MTGRLPDTYFDQMYAESDDPWQLTSRWYERRKYAITLATLPNEHYRHAFEPGCSVGELTRRLAERCDRVTSTDVAATALMRADRLLRDAGSRDQVTLIRGSIDQPWPPGPFDLVVLSEVAYYLDADNLRAVLDRECPRLPAGTTVVSAHWRHPVADYPISGDRANEVIAGTPGVHSIGSYCDADVRIEVFDTADPSSVATRSGIPGTER